jgi:alpha-beta hydrolase superfamily lysophospholipase
MKRRAFLASAASLPLLAACATPMVQRRFATGLSDFSGPALEEDGFASFDGARLGLKHWPAEGGAEPWAVIIGLHGMNDYSQAFHLAAPWWAGQGIATYAYDQRGFGRSPGRGIWAGEDLIVQDIRTCVALVRARHPNAVITVAGVSMGGSAAIAAFSSNDPPAADRLVLLAPGVWGWSAQPLPYKTALWLTAHTVPGKVVEPPAFVTSHVSPSDNREELIAMGRDPLMIWGARPDALYGLVSLMQTAWSRVGGIKVPVCYLYGDHDQIIPKAPTWHAAGGLKPTDRSGVYKDGWHLLLVDHQAQTVWRDVAGFIKDPRAPLVSGVPVIPGAPTAPNR